MNTRRSVWNAFCLCIAASVWWGSAQGQQRYSEKIFPADSIKIKEVVYAKVERNHGYIGDLLEEKLSAALNVNSDQLLLKELKADVYLPPQEEYIRPMIVFLHGGLFLAGNKKDNVVKVLAMEFARRGYVTASVNVRGLNKRANTIHDAAYLAMQDARAAVRYFRAEAGRFGIHPGHIWLAGESTGAITALHAGLIDPGRLPAAFSVFDEKLGVPDGVGTDLASFQVEGIISISGAVLDTQLLRRDPGPAIISFHGISDDVIPLDYGLVGEAFFNRLQERDFISRLAPNLMDTYRTMAPELFGSYFIHETLENFKNRRHSLILFDDGHHLVTGANGSRRRHAGRIVRETAQFIFPFLVDSASITGPDVVLRGAKAAYFSSNTEAAQYKWAVEGGEALTGAGSRIRVKWYKNAGSGRVTLSVMNQLGVWSPPVSRIVSFEQRLAFGWQSREVLITGIVFFSVLLAGTIGFRLRRNS